MRAEGLQTHKKPLLHKYVEQAILHKYTFGQFSNVSRWDCDRFNPKTLKDITESQEPGRGPRNALSFRKGSSSLKRRASHPPGLECEFLDSKNGLLLSTQHRMEYGASHQQASGTFVE